MLFRLCGVYRGLDAGEEAPGHEASRPRRAVVRLEAGQGLPRGHQGRPPAFQLDLAQQAGDLTKTQGGGGRHGWGWVRLNVCVRVRDCVSIGVVCVRVPAWC